MMNKLKNFSRFMSYVLRHNPSAIGANLDDQGWTDFDIFVNSFMRRYHVSRIDAVKAINLIVENDEKGRYQVSFSNPKKIRACQGHTAIKINFAKADPPEFLYHGTSLDFLNSILKDGIKSMTRHHVHLSIDKKSAMKVGQRHGKPVVLKIQAKKMQEDNYEFFLSENNIWLIDFVPPEYITV